MEKQKDRNHTIFLLMTLSFFLGIFLKTCSEKPERMCDTPTTKIVKEIETKTVYLKQDVKTLKSKLNKEDKPRIDSLEKVLISVISVKDFDKDTALNSCLNLVDAQKTVIKRQDTIILKQDTIIQNDEIVKSLLKNDVVFYKKKSRKNMWKGILIGGVTGVVGGYLIFNK